MEAAQGFIQQAVDVVVHTPEQVRTDGHTSYPRAIRETMGSIERTTTSIIAWSKITVASNSGTIPCVALEQVRRRRAFVVTRDELRNSLRPRRAIGDVVSLLEQRQAFLQRLAARQTLIQAAS